MATQYYYYYLTLFLCSSILLAIKLQVCGFAACQWREKYGQKLAVAKINPRDKHVYFGREDYIASTTYLVGSEFGNNFVMDEGTYTYTFSCPIPSNCPSSFEGTYGHIRYLIKVTFIRTGAADRIHNVGFTVLKLLDLNEESKVLQVSEKTLAHGVIRSISFDRVLPATTPWRIFVYFCLNRYI